MFRLRTAALGAALALAVGVPVTSALAQERGQTRSVQGRRGGPGAPGAGVQQALMKGIELSDAQKAQLQEVHARHLAERRALRDNLGGGRPDSAELARVRSLADRQQLAVRAILTTEQQATFDRNRTAVRERRVGEGMGRGAGRGEGRRLGRGGRRGQQPRQRAEAPRAGQRR